jgi:hypothetical protein
MSDRGQFSTIVGFWDAIRVCLQRASDAERPREQCVHMYGVFCTIHAGAQTPHIRCALEQSSDFDALFHDMLTAFAPRLRKYGMSMDRFFDTYRTIYGPDHTFDGES